MDLDLRDAFFIHKCPIILFIDELTSFGNKANPTKNPEIVDTVVELADTKEVGRTKAQNGKKGGTKTTEARLGFYGCAQDGDVFRIAVAGRKKQGIDERFVFEYSDPIEYGSLPDIPAPVLAELRNQFTGLKDKNRWKSPLTMAPDAEGLLLEFWKSQPTEVRQKVRLMKSLRRDIYLQAWSRGLSVAEAEDVQAMLREFERGLVVRRVMLRDDVPNLVGLYISRLKKVEQDMHECCNKGVPVKDVIKSIRDFQTETYAYKENELDTFRKAWDSFAKGHPVCVTWTAANGQNYTKFAPMPLEHEVWNWADLKNGDWRTV